MGYTRVTLTDSLNRRWGGERPGYSPTFFRCRTLATHTAAAPTASTRPRGTRVENSTLELPLWLCPSVLQGGLSQPATEREVLRMCWKAVPARGSPTPSLSVLSF